MEIVPRDIVECPKCRRLSRILELKFVKLTPTCFVAVQDAKVLGYCPCCATPVKTSDLEHKE